MNEKPSFIIKASGRSQLLINSIGLIVGAVLLLVLLFIRVLFSPLLFIIGFLVLALFMIGDYLIWQQRGIRSIEIDENGITLLRGKRHTPQRIERRMIRDIDICKKLNRRVVTISMGGKPDKTLPGVTTFRGVRTRITDDAFNEHEFTLFIARLTQFHQNNQHYS